MTDQSTCRLEASRVRSAASSHPLCDRDRKRVGDHEAADEQRDSAEAEQEVLDDTQTSWVSALSSRACAAAVFTCMVSESSG